MFLIVLWKKPLNICLRFPPLYTSSHNYFYYDTEQLAGSCSGQCWLSSQQPVVENTAATNHTADTVGRILSTNQSVVLTTVVPMQ